MLRYIKSLVFSTILCTIFMQSVVSAVSGNDWVSGNIISDDQFFNASTMNTSDIQSFLSSMVPSCDTNGAKTSEFGGGTRAQYGTSIGYPPPYTCLKDYVENPTTRQNNANGGSVSGGWSSAQIIKYASDAYGINPKSLIILLQKEQALITDTWPFPAQYRSATGYGCPDTAPCDTEYYGFYNQVMNAARQFQLYAKFPNNYRYKAYQYNSILWNPNLSCGSSNVYISNQATAGLYNYTPYQPNSAALNNLYGTGDSCSSYGNRNFWRLYNDWFGSTQVSETFIDSRAHVSNIGWMSPTKNGGIIGTTGQSRPMEALRIIGSVEYSTYNLITGWQPSVKSGMISGTTGLARPIQAVKINPLDSLSSKYDLYYRAHVSNVGWLDWAKNGEVAGTTGNNNNIEAVEIRLVVKGYGIPGSTVSPYINQGLVTYIPTLGINVTSHVSDFGWLPQVYDTMTAGTVEQSKRMEAIQLSLINNTGLTGSVVYSSHLQDIGWQQFKKDGEISGTIGESRRMEAIRISLVGKVSEEYDLWYRAHVQNLGWLGWVKNGAIAGSIGEGLRLEGLETRMVKKDSTPPLTSLGIYNPKNLEIPETYRLSYSTHQRNVGWISGTLQNQVGGSTGLSRPLEAIRFDTISSDYGDFDISCSVFVKDFGWSDLVSRGMTCGTTGQSKPILAVKLSISSEFSTRYDLLYRVHSSMIGWQDWVNNGKSAGNSINNIEAISIKIMEKN